MSSKIVISVIAVAGIVVFLLAIRGPAKKTDSPVAASVNSNAIQGDIVSQEGIHWHPELSITIQGQTQPIPENIGVGMQFAGYPQYDSMMMMTDMHTHDTSGKIHWEVMEGPVKKDDIRLDQFFSVWGKKFTNQCIFDKCSGPEGRLLFMVNGKENPDFENYLVQDKDKIEIVFE